jgi:hypothetical protein
MAGGDGAHRLTTHAVTGRRSDAPASASARFRDGDVDRPHLGSASAAVREPYSWLHDGESDTCGKVRARERARERDRVRPNVPVMSPGSL